MKNSKLKNKKRKIEKMLDIPKEVYSEIPKITIVGFEEMIIENHKGIIEYEDYFVKINTVIGTIHISGINLKLDNMSNDDIKVIGTIENFEIERNE